MTVDGELSMGMPLLCVTLTFEAMFFKPDQFIPRV